MEAESTPGESLSPTTAENRRIPVDTPGQVDTTSSCRKNETAGAQAEEEAKPASALNESSMIPKQAKKPAKLAKKKSSPNVATPHDEHEQANGVAIDLPSECHARWEEPVAYPKTSQVAGVLEEPEPEAGRSAATSSDVPAGVVNGKASPEGKLGDVLYTINTLRAQVAELAKQQELAKSHLEQDSGIAFETEKAHEILGGLNALTETVNMRFEACENQLLEINSKQDTMGQLLSMIVQRLAPSLTHEPGTTSFNNDHEHGKQHEPESELNGISGIFGSTTIAVDM